MPDLKWRADDYHGRGTRYTSTTEFHEILRGYTVYPWDKHWRVEGLRRGRDHCAVADTADEAKAIAQQDYNDRRRLKDWENYMLAHEPPRGAKP